MAFFLAISLVPFNNPYNKTSKIQVIGAYYRNSGLY